MADHDHTYKLLFSHAEMVRDLIRGFVHEDWVRTPGIEIPQVADLQEVKSMLEERVTQWTRQWKQEGFEEGLEEGLEKGLEEGLEKGREESLERMRGALLQGLEDRFGDVPESLRRKVATLGSIEEIADLIARSATAPSLDALGL